MFFIVFWKIELLKYVGYLKSSLVKELRIHISCVFIKMRLVQNRLFSKQQLWKCLWKK